MPAGSRRVARDLNANRGKSLVIAGETQPAEVHALAHLINHSLGNIGKTVEFFPRADAGPADQIGSLRELARDIEAGAVETLIILGGNPAYDAPADLDFARVLASEKTKLRIHLGLYDDETARLCHWHIPQAHCLETWSDLRAFDGTATIQQPLIAPLYKGRSPHELLALLLGQPDLSSSGDRSRLLETPGTARAISSMAWREALEAGRGQGNGLKAQGGRAAVKEIPESPADSPTARKAWRSSFGLTRRSGTAGSRITAGFRNCPSRSSKLSWDSAALLSPATAQRLGIENEDVLELTYRGRSVQIPAWIMPGQADQSITVFLGHGRRRAGRVGTGVGVDVYGLRTSDAPVVRRRPRGQEDRRAPAAGRHASSFQHGRKRSDPRRHAGTVSRAARLRRQDAEHEAARARELDRRSRRPRHTTIRARGMPGAWRSI